METTEKNRWQELAEKTNDIVTPANALTLSGLALTIKGSMNLRGARGFSQLVVGRLADASDGWVARRTGTATKLGEMMDAGADKIATATVLYQAYKQDVMPRWSMNYMAVQNAANVGLSMVAQSRGKEMHSSKAGKLNTAAQSAAFFAYAAGEVLLVREHEKAAERMRRTGDVLSMVSVGLGGVATAGYARKAFAEREDS